MYQWGIFFQRMDRCLKEWHILSTLSMDIVFNTDYYHRRIIDGTVLYGDEGDPSWTQLYIQGVLAEF